jgi:hypothetical protein
MNQVQVIRIGVVIAVVIYVIYLAFQWKNKPLLDTANLLVSQTPIAVTDNPASVNYTYSAWIYVNVFPSNASSNLKLLSRNTSGNSNQFSLYLDKTTPTLTVAVDPSNVSILTTNFPLQKWTYVAISVTSTLVDSYLDGKLVASKAFTSVPTTPSANSATSLVVGDTSSLQDITLANISRLSRASSPDEIWNRYIAGNGNWWTYLGLSAYNATVSVKKDGTEEASMTLF